MVRRTTGLLVIALAMILVPAAVPQQTAQPVYTFVSQFQIPRANWAQYSEDTEKTFVPIAERLTADGTLVGWDTFEQVVHTPDGYTHGASWSSNSIAGIMKVLEEIRKVGPRPGQIAATKHEDYLMQSTMYHASSGSGTSGYLRVVCSMAHADKPSGYVAAVKKLLMPTFEEEFKKGVVTYYGMDEQYVNTTAPSLRCLVISYPDAGSIDKWATAINTTLGRMTAAERETFMNASVLDSRRDIMARITHYAHK